MYVSVKKVTAVSQKHRLFLIDVFPINAQSDQRFLLNFILKRNYCCYLLTCDFADTKLNAHLHLKFISFD